MIYLATITTPANTLQQNAIETNLIITKGLIYLIEIEFPAGCSGLVKMQIFDGSYQLFPATPGEFLRGDNVVAKYEDSYLKQSAPYVLKILTYNEDTIYNHTIQVRCGLASAEAFMARFLPSITWDKFNEVLSQATQQQEQIKQQTVAEIQALLPPDETQTETQ